MAKTRAQTRDLGIKKEEEEDCKPTLLLNRVSDTRSKNRVAKRKSIKSKNRPLPSQQVKVEEEDTDTKSLLKSISNHSKHTIKPKISQEQINQLIDYIVNDKLSVRKAAPKVNICYQTAAYYYNEYKNDLEKKIPSPRNRFMQPRRCYSQEQIQNLIRYIDGDKMSVKQASSKANINHQSGIQYYKRYLNDPDHNIPIPRLCQYRTQDQKNEFISYIVNNKMSIGAASKKAKISVVTGFKHYHKYFKDQNPDIPTPSHIVTHKHYTQEQIKEVISYIVDDKMTITAASRKANMPVQTVTKHYRQYLKDHNMECPLSRTKRQYTQDQINELMGYIVDGKMTTRAASKKANINYNSGKKYYREYRNKHNIDLPALKYRQDKIMEIAGYVFDDKMSVRAAAKKANVSASTGQYYYRKYLVDKKRDTPS